MDDYMKMGVKPLIEAVPEVGTILDRYGIGCVQCTIGTCKFEDVVKLHALPSEDETQVMLQVEQAIYPERDVPPPQARAAAAPPRGPEIESEIVYSPPVQRLVDEHKWIKRLLALVPDIVSEMRASGEMDADLLLAAVDFIRGYADRFHHMKEEDILFDYTDREAQVVRVILEDHDHARAFVRAIVQATEDGDPAAAWANLTDYRALLTEHITKEDEILYPHIDRALTTSQVGEIFRRFEEVEAELPDDIPHRYERFIIGLAARFQREEAIR